MCVKPHAALFTKSLKVGRKWDIEFIDSAYHDEIEKTMGDMVHSSILNGVPAKWSMIPCGQCFECRLQRSRVWANRCVLEMSSFPPLDGVCRNWFVTLTYAPDHTDDLRSFVDGNTLSLHQPEEGKTDHLQMFNNAVRQKWKRHYSHQGIRFYSCGEYGDLNARPHYHELLFNLPIDPDDLEYLFTNKFGNKYYNHKLLQEAWSDKGFVVISEANWQNAAYTARYILKKQTGDGAAMYSAAGIKPPFTRMSLKPGIGIAGYKGLDTYFKRDPEGHLIFHDQIYLPAEEGVSPTARPPRYFDRLFERDEPELMDVIRAHREEFALIAYRNDKIQRCVSDRELFDIREDEYHKLSIGSHRRFTETIY